MDGRFLLVDVEIVPRALLVLGLIAIKPGLPPRSLGSKRFGSVFPHPLEHAHNATTP